jgi:hypothetical protein
MFNSLNIFKCVAIFHLFGMMFENTYGIISYGFIKFGSKNYIILDKLYIITFIFIPLSWSFCKDECIISYLIKKYENPKYILGSEPENATDLINLFPNKNIYFTINTINPLLRIVSVMLVNNRTTKISYYTISPAILLYLFYIYDIIFKFNYRKKNYLYLQIIFSYYLLYFLLSNIGVHTTYIF